MSVILRTVYAQLLTCVAWDPRPDQPYYSGSGACSGDKICTTSGDCRAG
ncbi:hypothetical protein PI124_g16553 [Phytophthora idaei]|nr:hypothetical protein PI125_g3808 [Phytophthora idaei]KAG3143091.1 hypothetical protein PI126_g14775 [Phytophthora idaei]KAG3238485.1 hypothetical protein PI124_g16553 [Phytophthora idaei]